ncbi:MAG: class I SAM-dependent methyltransferase [Acidobacteria bacterium]|nr:class I SAM-dependent methyltransferase [Acidobacteriota bacterium]
MEGLKNILKGVPGLQTAYRFARSQYESAQLEGKAADEVFGEIWSGNKWGGTDSVSGRGSDLTQTQVVRETLPVVFQQYGVKSMLDVPCGDFHWMRHVDLSGVDYVGGDIVAELVERNTAAYQTGNVRFVRLNLLEDAVPKVDLVFCRDCLVHLSFEHVFAALRQICASESQYLLTTTFVDRQQNGDIATGNWRPLNLRVAPFEFPESLLLVNEKCTEDGGQFRDKSLGLWKVSDLRALLG